MVTNALRRCNPGNFQDFGERGRPVSQAGRRGFESHRPLWQQILTAETFQRLPIDLSFRTGGKGSPAERGRESFLNSTYASAETTPDPSPPFDPPTAAVHASSESARGSVPRPD